jgi:hypothetical protein
MIRRPWPKKHFKPPPSRLGTVSPTQHLPPLAVAVLTPLLDPEPNRLKNIEFWQQIAHLTNLPVIIHTPQPTYPEGRIYSGYRLSRRTKEAHGAVTVHRHPTMPNRSGSMNIARVVWSLSNLLPAVGRLQQREIRSRTVVYSYQGNPMNTLAAAALAKRNGGRLIVDVQDPWPARLDAAQSTSSVRRSISNVTNCAYRRVVRHAATITPAFTTSADPQVTSVANWSPDESAFDPFAERSRRLLYAGSLGRAQRLSEWMETLSQLISLEVLEGFDMFGTGPQVDEVRRRLTSSMSLHEPIPVEALAGCIRHVWGLVPLASGLLDAGFAPQKIAYYLSRGVVPIVAIASPTSGDLASVPPGCLVVDQTIDSWRTVLQSSESPDPVSLRALYDEHYSKSAGLKRVSSVILNEIGHANVD